MKMPHRAMAYDKRLDACGQTEQQHKRRESLVHVRPAPCRPVAHTTCVHTPHWLTFCLWGGALPSAKPHTSVLHAKLARRPPSSVSCSGPAICAGPAGVCPHVGE